MAVPGWEINTGLDQLGRLGSLGVSKLGTGIEQFRIFHHYDQAGRLGSISSGGAAAHYGYEPAHQALRQIAISVNDTPVLYGNLQYDSLLQLRRISYHNGDLQGTLKAYSDFQYVRNDLGNITSITMKDRSKQLVGYNAAGEVVKTEHLLDAAGTDRRRGGNFAWTYDGIGNRLSAARGGDSAGANLRASTYTPNALNQYDTITQPGAVDVTGRAPLADSVTVNGDLVVRQGGRFHREVTADNSGGPVWKEILVANGTDSLDGFSLIPPATRTPVHDADGNLTHDGVHHYSWDAENRLIKIETLAAAVTAGVPYRRVEYLYDSNWRRVQRLRHDQPGSATPVESTRYLWAGWRCLAEVDAGGELAKTFVWGLDSRQSLHLGDGNGALLWINDLTLAQRHFCHYDGNGNITGLSDATGAQTAEYLYNAFGELLERSGSYADKNLYRFSTKPYEVVGGLYYYGYRYYDPATGRWPSRDPLQEPGGINLYGFVKNNSFFWIDRLGLDPTLPTPITIDEAWDLLVTGGLRAWPLPPSKMAVHISSEHTRILEKNCPCTKENVLDGYEKLIDAWVEWAVRYEKLHGIPIGGEGKTDASSCITVNSDLYEDLRLNVPGCWTCKMEEGWRNLRPNELNWRGKLNGGRANHWWITCTGRDNEGNVVKEASFDYWRPISDVWGGMAPSVNRIAYPYLNETGDNVWIQ
jgi:RHS repeat-associated protein